jgi:Spy/CpxP family protein refolding chaperone
MNSSLKWKLTVAFLLVFIAGVVTGMFAGALHARHTFFLGPPHPEQLGKHMREHLREELGLTDEQVAQIGPTIDTTVAKLDAIRTETTARVRETMEASHREIATHLTPEQQKKLDALEREHQRRLRHHGLPMHGEPPP